MFTLRKNSSKRASLSFLPPQNHSEFQQNCSSLLVTDDLPRDNLIFLMLNSGCFREIMRSNSAAGMQYSTASICNQICSLLVFSSREFTQNAEESAERIRCSAENELIMDQQITVLLDAPKVPMKALRLVLRACQSALAYKIRQCVLLEQDWFVQHRVALDVILHEKYDFKVIVCPHSKLLHYIGLATLFDLQSIWSEKTATTAEGRRQQRKSLLAETENNAEIGKRNGETLTGGKWVDQKKAFSMFFAANPSYSLSMGSPSANVSTASLLRLMRKDRTILIELVEHDLDSVAVSPTSPMPAVQQNQNRALLQEKFCGFIEEKSQTKGTKPADVLSNFGRTRLELPLVVGRNGGRVRISIAQRQQKQRHSLLSNGFSSSFTDFSSMNEEQLSNKPQKEGEFEYICSSSVGSIIERNGGNWPTEKPVDEFVASVHRVAESVRLLLEWTSEHGEKQLSSMNELWWKLWTSFNGEIFYLDFIERERTTLTEETEEKVNELANAKDEMDQVERRLKTNGFLENPSKQLIATVGQSLLKAEMRIYRLRNALNSYKIRIDNARRFKEIIEEFHKECDALLLMLYDNDGNGKGGRTLKMNEYQTKERINSIRERQTNIEKYVGLASETSSSFRFLMRQSENGRHQSIKKMNDCAEKAVQLISADFDALTKRRHRFDGMVELWVRMINSQLSVPLRKEVQHNVTASFCGDLMSDGGRETTKRKERQHI